MHMQNPIEFRKALLAQRLREFEKGVDFTAIPNNIEEDNVEKALRDTSHLRLTTYTDKNGKINKHWVHANDMATKDLHEDSHVIYEHKGHLKKGKVKRVAANGQYGVETSTGEIIHKHPHQVKHDPEGGKAKVLNIQEANGGQTIPHTEDAEFEVLDDQTDEQIDTEYEGYHIQIVPYADKKYIANHFDKDKGVITPLGHFNKQEDALNTIKETFNKQEDKKKEIPVKEIQNLFDAGKSLPVEKAVKYLKDLGFDVEHKKYTTYRDKKVEGRRYVTSRKEVKVWRVEISKGGKTVRTFDSGTSMHTSYSLTHFVLNEIK